MITVLTSATGMDKITALTDNAKSYTTLLTAFTLRGMVMIGSAS